MSSSRARIKCDTCSSRNVFAITKEKINPVDGDECGVFGLAKCSDVYYKYCFGQCYSPVIRERTIQLTLDFSNF